MNKSALDTVKEREKLRERWRKRLTIRVLREEDRHAEMNREKRSTIDRDRARERVRWRYSEREREKVKKRERQ